MSNSNGKKRFWFVILAVVLAIMICLGGIAAGLYFGWVVLPVQWVDMAPNSLAEPFQDEYMRMAIDSFTVNKNCTTATQRYNSLGENQKLILNTIIEHPGEQNPKSISAFSKCVVK
jgi:hypothetical protein